MAVEGLIIPRAWNEYINKSDPVAMREALQLSGVMDAAPTAGSNKPAKSGGIFAANAVIMASGTTLTGVTIASGSIIRVMFTAAVNGSDTTTGLSLTYNGTSYAVKVGKNGALANFVASAVSGGYVYVQAYTTLELAFDGTQFVIIGNPVVISSSDYTIYADGQKTYHYNDINNKWYTGFIVKVQNVGCYVNIPLPMDLLANYSITLDDLDFSGLVNLHDYDNVLIVETANLRITSSYDLSQYVGSQVNARLSFTPN